MISDAGLRHFYNDILDKNELNRESMIDNKIYDFHNSNDEKCRVYNKIICLYNMMIRYNIRLQQTNDDDDFEDKMIIYNQLMHKLYQYR